MLGIPHEIQTPFCRHEVRRAAILTRELRKAVFAGFVKLAKGVLRLFRREKTRCFHEGYPSSLTCRQTSQRRRERVLAYSRQPGRIRGCRAPGAEDLFFSKSRRPMRATVPGTWSPSDPNLHNADQCSYPIRII
jgi:hypothetical protein